MKRDFLSKFSKLFNKKQKLDYTINTYEFFKGNIILNENVKNKIDDDLKQSIKTLINNERKLNTTIINSDKTVSDAFIEDIKQQANFDMLKFNLSWQSSFSNGYYPLLKFTLLFNLCRKLGVLNYVTYQQEFLKLLYDGSYILRNALQLQTYFAFNDLNFQSKKDNLNTSKVNKLKFRLFEIIEMSELTGGVVVEIKEDNIEILNEREFDIEKENSLNKNNKFLFSSINKPISEMAQKSFKPFGLSCFEDKMFIIESIIELERSRNEIINKMIQITLSETQQDQDSFGNNTTPDERSIARKRAELIAQAGNMSCISLPYGWQLNYASANIDLRQFIEIYNHLMMQLTGLPKEIFSNENGSINIGSREQEENVLLRCFKQKMRNNYTVFIEKLAKKYLNEEDVVVVYDDIKTLSGINEIKNLNELSDTALKFSNIPDLQEELNDFARKILDKIKDKVI